MKEQEVKQKISSKFSDAGFIEENTPFLGVIIPSENLYSLAEFLKKNEEMAFNFLFCLSGADMGDYFKVVYHLTSTANNHSVVIHAKIIDRETPAVDSVCALWKTAEFHEREVFDLFGITFNDHPDMRRILLDDDWKGHPLRKDYVDEVNIVDL